MTIPEALALFDEEGQPSVLAHTQFYVPAPSRGGSSARTLAGGVFLHDPTVAVLLPSDLPLLSRRRPDIARLRHVLVRFSFMLDRLPPRHAYQSVTLTVALDHPDAVVRLQRPAWVTPNSELTDTTTTELAAAVEGLARLSAQRTRVKGATRHDSPLPVITAEKRDRGDFGWRYEAREGAPLLPRVEFAMAGIELPRDLTELCGHLSAEALVDVPRFGVLTASRAVPAKPPATFVLPLGGAG